LIPIQPKALGSEQRRLLKLFGVLDAQRRRTLLDFAEFLAAREVTEPESAPAVPEAPKPIPRPEEESVVAAIRRLSESYSMLERQDMLNETASLMAAHVLQGRSANEVVDELESLFEARYERYLEAWRD
jgi:hypothetical protein